MIGERVRTDVNRFADADTATWDDFVRASKNGTFLFLRDYMTYHADRFVDASLMVYEGDELVAVLPAHREGDRLVSHNGLTYGGLVVGFDMTLPRYLEVFDALLVELQARGVRELLVKSSPSIYHQAPADEDLVAMYLLGAEVVRTCALSVIMPDSRVPVQVRRRRGIDRAERHPEGLWTQMVNDYPAMWDLLDIVLPGKPTHSLDEITRLHGRFPRNIKQYGCFHGAFMHAGVVIYETERVARAQYIASTPDGKLMGATDLLMSHLIETYTRSGRAFDMGTSSNEDGRRLERGIVEYKEGWGARTIAYSHYCVNVAGYEPGSLMEALQ